MAATANDLLFDRALRHQIYLNQHEGSVAKDIVKLLNRIEEKVVRELKRKDLTSLSRDRKNLLLNRIRKLVNADSLEMTSSLRREIRQLSKLEASFQARMINGSIPVPVELVIPAPNQLYAAVKERPFNGRILKQWTDGLRRGVVDNIHNTIQQGYAEGQTTEQVIRSIRGTRRLNYTDGVTEKSRRWTRAVVRTSLNHTSNAARELTYEQNNNVIKGVQYVATLDSRTTLICASHDGKVYKVNQGPRPPLHPNCRSTTIPVVKSWKEMGINLKQAPPGTRASLNGQVSAKTTYEQFLKRQPKSFQEDVLGKTRAQLFRKGKLPLDKFVNQSGNTLTLDQLRTKEADAFKSAGL